MRLVQFPLHINIKGELIDNKGDVVATPSDNFETAFSQIQDQLELDPDNVFQSTDVFFPEELGIEDDDDDFDDEDYDEL
jgi:hypothetical protein